MSLLAIALRNLRHQARNYGAFFLSSTFAVWIFFLYAALLFHPEVGGDRFPPMIREVLAYLEGIVALFAVLFIRYAHAAFLRARMRELAIWKLVGLRPRDLARLVAGEMLLMGLGALVLGGGLGVLFLRLFLLGMSRALQLDRPLPDHLAWPAVGLTVVTFLLIFGLITLFGRRMLERLPVAELFREQVKPREEPVQSGWGLLACGVNLGLAYTMAVTAGEHVEEILLPMLGCWVLGTYLLFTQGSVALLRWLKRQPRFYLRGTNLLTIAQSVYKMKENARILFLITLLSTVSLTALGLWYGVYRSAAAQAEWARPVAFAIALPPGGVLPERIEQALGPAITARAAIPSLTGPMHRTVPLGAVNGWLRQLGRAEVALEPDGAVLERFFNQPVRVVSDQVFQEMAAAQPTEMLHLFQVDDWRRRVEEVVALRREVEAGWPAEQGSVWPPRISGTGLFYQEHIQTGGFLLVVGSFIGLLFLLASGNLLYFKLFTDLLEERHQFQGLARVGIRPVEVRRVVSVQTGILFFLPLLLAVANGLIFVAMIRPFSRFFDYGPVLVVAALYALLFLGYWLATRRVYVQALLRQS